MKVLISHPTGNEFFRAAATGLLDADMLSEFHTTVATFPGNVFDRLGALPGFSEFKRRHYNPSLKRYTKAWPWYELGRFASARVGFTKLMQHEKGLFSIDAVYHNQDRRVANSLKLAAKTGTKAIYAYEDGALFSFREAKKQSIKCLYDLPIGYWRVARKLLDAERERWPDWAPTMTGFGDSEAKLARKDEELQRADAIFVASTFTASTLNFFPSKLAPVEIIPYGFPAVCDDRQYTPITRRPLKILFVGGLSQRKGIADLFASVKTFGRNVALTVVGRNAGDNCPVLNEALETCTWFPSLPHSEILKVMRENDVLVFPSNFEGFGLVITEAMSQGTPVITTDRTAGPDFIKHNENGWLINAGSTEALQLALEEILMHPETVKSAGAQAMELARKRTWDVYGEELVRAILRNTIASNY